MSQELQNCQNRAMAMIGLSYTTLLALREVGTEYPELFDLSVGAEHLWRQAQKMLSEIQELVDKERAISFTTATM